MLLGAKSFSTLSRRDGRRRLQRGFPLTRLPTLPFLAPDKMSMSGLFRYVGDDVTLGTPPDIVQANDQFGTHHATQETEGQEPHQLSGAVLGHDSMAFAAADSQFLEFQAAAVDDWTFAAVMAFSAPSAAVNTLLGVSGSTAFSIQWDGPNNYFKITILSTEITCLPIAAVEANAYYRIIIWHERGTASGFLVNGRYSGAMEGVDALTVFNQLGAVNSATFFNGDTPDVSLWSGVPKTLGEAHALDRWLARRY